MKGIENQLPPDVFTRIHRSFIINKRMIRAINENSLDLIIGYNVRNLPIGKSYRMNLMNDITIVDKKNPVHYNHFYNSVYADNQYE